MAETRPARAISLDALRGGVVALMILMDHPTVPAAVPWWLLHPLWNGFQLADAIFPSFLFIVGVSMAFASRDGRGSGWKNDVVFLRRVAVLFVLGLGLSFIKYPLPLRITGVLQRIALASLIAYPFRHQKRWVMLTVAGSLLAVHTAILLGGAPGVPPWSLGPAVNMTRWVDTLIIGASHAYKHGVVTDPENLLGTLGAGAEVLLGLAVGRTMTMFAKDQRTDLNLALVSVAGIAASLVAWQWLPANKPLWTATFTVLSASVICLVLVGLHYLADVRGHNAALRPLVPIGRNALIIYVGSAVLVAGLRHIPLPPTEAFVALGTWASRLVGRTAGTLSLSAIEVAGWGVVAWVMARNRFFVKL